MGIVNKEDVIAWDDSGKIICTDCGEIVGIWHYTIGQCLPGIFESNEIKLATTGLPRKVKPAVWFSTNPVWEETARKLHIDEEGKVHFGTKETTHIMGGGLIRIEVFPEAAPYIWKDYKRMSGKSKVFLKALESAAREQGANPEEWRVSFKPVSKEEWLNVEIWDSKTDEWIDLMEAYEKERSVIRWA